MSRILTTFEEGLVHENSPLVGRMLAFMREREWELTDDRKHVVCVTCGAKHLDSKAKKTHRRGCGYQAAMLEAKTVVEWKAALDDEEAAREKTRFGDWVPPPARPMNEGRR